MTGLSGSARCGVVPPYLLRALSRSPDERAAQRARRSLDRDTRLREERAARLRAGSAPAVPGRRTATTAGPQRTISDAHGEETTPGTRVRAEGDAPTGDAAADEAYEGFGATWHLYDEVYGRDSVDGRGMPLLGTVHYGHDYDNAFWDGTQMVFGDGDGTVFTRFTIAVDVIGHELTHGVTEHTAALVYQGQSGALNESISDVFGSLVKQRSLGQAAADADWLIGAGLFLPSVHGVALRSMKAPGTAYDDPQLGKDPQPATMDGYVDTSDDNGGVHLNSGIPNHAFYLAATAIGGNAWEGAGRVWYDVLTAGQLPHDCDFATFAAATVAAAGRRFGSGTAGQVAVERAWAQVGITTGGGSATPVSAPVSTPAGRRPGSGAGLRLRRTGGLAGQTRERTVDLSELPGEDAASWRTLLASELRDLLEPGRAVPDAFTYHVASPPDSEEVALPEHRIPAEVRALFARTLEA
jgi:hypothetical protein